MVTLASKAILFDCYHTLATFVIGQSVGMVQSPIEEGMLVDNELIMQEPNRTSVSRCEEIPFPPPELLKVL